MSRLWCADETNGGGSDAADAPAVDDEDVVDGRGGEEDGGEVDKTRR